MTFTPYVLEDAVWTWPAWVRLFCWEVTLTALSGATVVLPQWKHIISPGILQRKEPFNAYHDHSKWRPGMHVQLSNKQGIGMHLHFISNAFRNSVTSKRRERMPVFHTVWNNPFGQLSSYYFIQYDSVMNVCLDCLSQGLLYRHLFAEIEHGWYM